VVATENLKIKKDRIVTCSIAILRQSPFPHPLLSRCPLTSSYHIVSFMNHISGRLDMPRMSAIPSHERDTDLSSPRLDPTEDIWMAISRPGSNLAEYETFTQPTFSQYKRQLVDGLIDGITIHRRPSATTLGSLKAAGILPSGETLDSRIRLPSPDAWTPKQMYSVSMFWRNGEGSIVAQGVAVDEEHLVRSVSQVTRSRDTPSTDRQDIDVLIVSRVTTRYLQDFINNGRKMTASHPSPFPLRSTFPAATIAESQTPDQTLRVFGGFTAVPNEVFTFPLLTMTNALQELVTSGQLDKLRETSHGAHLTLTVLQPVLSSPTEQVLRTRLAASSSVERPGTEWGRADWLVESFTADMPLRTSKSLTSWASSASSASSRPWIRCRAKWMNEQGLSGTLRQVTAPHYPVVAARCTFSPRDSGCRLDSNSNTSSISTRPQNFDSASDSGVGSTLQPAHVSMV
jgi:hypothetical protein